MRYQKWVKEFLPICLWAQNGTELHRINNDHNVHQGFKWLKLKILKEEQRLYQRKRRKPQRAKYFDA